MLNEETLTAHNAEVARIAGLLAWNQPLTETDKLFWRDHLLAKWEASKKALEVAKADEMEQRKAVVAFAFDPNKKAGTERVELANGYELKAVKKINYGFVKTPDGKLDKNAVDSALRAIEAKPNGELIAERLVKWNPDLSLTEYKQLPADMKAIIDAVIVTTDGAPSLEIVPPKGQR